MLSIEGKEEFKYCLLIYLKNKDIAKFRSNFLQLHPNSQLIFFNALDDSYRQIFYDFILPDEFANIFSKINLLKKQLIIEEVCQTYMFALIDSLRTDEVVRFLSSLKLDDVEYYLKNIKMHDTNQINLLLTYKADTAGSMVATEYVTAFTHETVATVLRRLKSIKTIAKTIYYIYVITNTNQLIGVVSLRDLIVTPSEHTIGFTMKKQVISVRPSTKIYSVIKTVKDYDLLFVPVIDETNELIGIVSVDDILGIDVDTRWRYDFSLLSLSKLKGNFFLILIPFISFILATVIVSTKISIKAITFTTLFALLIAAIAGIFSTKSATLNLHSLAKKRLGRDVFRPFITENFLTAFILAIISAILSSIIGVSFIEYNEYMGILFGLAMFSAVFCSVLAGSLIPYMTIKYKTYSKNIIMSINTIITSIICFTVTIVLFYIV